MDVLERVEWRAVGLSVRGSSHEARKQPCQDAHRHCTVGDEWVIAGVADGAGSAALAEVGARVAVDHAVEALTDRLRAHLASAKPMTSEEGWHEALTEVLYSTRAAVEREAAGRREPVKALSTTLLLMLLGPSVTVAAQIGDGAVVVLGEDGTIEALTRPQPPLGPDDDPDPINGTVFLTTMNGVENAQFAYRATTVKSTAVLTDGLQLLAFDYPGWTPFVPFFRPLFQIFERQTDDGSARSELEGILNSEDIRSRADDDLTLLVVTRGSVPAADVGPLAAPCVK